MSEAKVRVLEPRGSRLVDWEELHRYRDLFYLLVWRDMKVRYKQTVLGLAWAVVPPLVTMALFTVVFGRLAEVPSDGIPYPLFSLAALLPWTYFASSLTAASGSLVGNALLSKVYFPRLLIPITPVLVNLLDLAVAGLLLVPLMIWYGVAPGWEIVFLPFLILVLVASAAGAGFWLSSLAIQYRDVKFGIGFLVQILMYAAPVVWPVSLIEDRTLRLVYAVYPVVGVIEGFRAALLDQTPMPWDLLAVSSVGAAVLLVTGVAQFQRRQHVFADVF